MDVLSLTGQNYIILCCAASFLLNLNVMWHNKRALYDSHLRLKKQCGPRERAHGRLLLFNKMHPHIRALTLTDAILGALC